MFLLKDINTTDIPFQENMLALSCREVTQKNTTQSIEDILSYQNDEVTPRFETGIKYDVADVLQTDKKLGELINLIDNAEVLFCDLDKTLSASKKPINSEMTVLLKMLLEDKELVIETGGKFEIVVKHVVVPLEKIGADVSKVTILPVLGNECFKYDKNEGKHVFFKENPDSVISDAVCEEIEVALESVFKIYGHPNTFEVSLPNDSQARTFPIRLSTSDMIEKRGVNNHTKNMSIAFFGQKVQKELSDYKKYWDPDAKKREKLIAYIEDFLDEDILQQISLTSGGSTTIDITRKGCNKATGVKWYRKEVDSFKESLYFGDSFGERGNDLSVYNETDIICAVVENETQTAELFRKALLVKYFFQAQKSGKTE